MKFSKKFDKKGFSLVELMIVVAIIGILATIAAPRYRNFSAKAKTSEAKTTLSTIATMMESYRAEYDTYVVGGFANIGFQQPVGNRYTYSLQSTAADTYVANGVIAANGLGAGCTQDIWNINQDRNLANPNKVVCN